jgi:excisionase family DNA binding protein
MSSDMSATEPSLLTLQEAADIVGCHYQTLYRRVRKGEVPALVAGGSYRISRVDLDTWLHERDATAGAVPQRAERDWPRQSDALIALQRRVKRAFDPRELLNPDKVLPPPGGHRSC